MADVAELSPFGQVAYHSGKGPGENHKSSPRLSPLADYRPNRGLPHWDSAEVTEGAVWKPRGRACPVCSENRLIWGGVGPECSMLTWAVHKLFVFIVQIGFSSSCLFSGDYFFLWITAVKQFFFSGAVILE